MIRKRALIIILSIIAGLSLGSFFFFPGSQSETIPVSSPFSEESSPQADNSGANSSPSAKVLSTSDLWNIFSNYRDAARRNDIKALESSAFMISSVCKVEGVSTECKKRMDDLYVATKDLSINKFTESMADERQAILSTSFVFKEDTKTVRLSKAMIFFARRDDGRLGVIALDPERVWIVNKSSTSTEVQLRDRLNKLSFDSDKDGITDDFENCVFPDSLIVLSECTKTDPNNKDSDGDLWWDGIDAYIKAIKNNG